MDNQILEEKIFHKVMKNMPFGMVVCKEGRKRKVYYVNREAYEMLGYTKQEYLEKIQDGWAAFMGVDIREVLQKHHEEIRFGREFEVVTKTKRKTGEDIYLLNRIVIKMEDGPVSYVNVSDVTKRMEQEKMFQQEHESLRLMATQDSLTKLLNRGTMEKKISAALTHADNSQECAYIAMDLDNFKRINDFYGHGVGDMVILELAELLKLHFERDAYIGRMGGDEFAVFLRNVEDRDEILERTTNILEGVHELKYGMELRETPSISVGIAFHRKGETDFQRLYHSADIALYKIKNRSKDGIAVL